MERLPVAEPLRGSDFRGKVAMSDGGSSSLSLLDPPYVEYEILRSSDSCRFVFIRGPILSHLQNSPTFGITIRPRLLATLTSSTRL